MGCHGDAVRETRMLGFAAPESEHMTNSTKIQIPIEDELRSSYLEYAMSVIVGRAIPDVRDGLKPVHRRILYAMHEMRLNWNQPYRKSARVVGEVLGKYHPHGDAAVYDALVRMAQDFSMRYPLVDGQGNFGSVDGDQPAAMRYTESRMSRLASELLADIDKETVDFGPNFDDSEREPLPLPSRVPNLLVNGSAGIAVGMATNVPPHNIREVIDATVRVMHQPEISIDELMTDDEEAGRIGLRGPDFPTAGFIYGTAGIRQGYHTGRGRVIMRARVHTEPIKGKNDRLQLVVTELPYMVNKAELVKKIAQLVRDKDIDGISDLRDESDREGMRIVIELKRDAADQIVLNQLYQQTQLQSTFGVNMLAIVGGRPRLLNLKEMLQYFVDHRREVVTRRTRFELRQAESQLELVLGLGMAVTEVDLIVKTIRESKDAETAKGALIALPLRGLEEFLRRAGRPEPELEVARNGGDYHLSERQAKAILEMRLARLTGLEREKLAAEYSTLCETIARLKAILGSDDELKRVIITELDEIKERYGDARRSEIVHADGDIQIEDTDLPRRRGGHRHPRRLHQTCTGHGVSCPGARRSRKAGDGDARRRFRRANLRRQQSRPCALSKRTRDRVPEEGVRNPRGLACVAGQGTGQFRGTRSGGANRCDRADQGISRGRRPDHLYPRWHRQADFLGGVPKHPFERNHRGGAR